MSRQRRTLEGFTLSFLDVISCGFGAIVLLLVISKIGEPAILEDIRRDLTGVIVQQKADRAEIHSEIRRLLRMLVSEEDQLALEESELARLRGDLSSIRGQFAAADETSAIQNTIEGKLASAKQEMTEEMERLLGAAYRRKRSDTTVAGIPVDSEYIILIIDTSGSMQDFAWPMLVRKVAETLQIYPVVKGIQVLNDNGEYLFPQYRGKWIPDSPGRRKAIISRLEASRSIVRFGGPHSPRGGWEGSDSDPTDGIIYAIQQFYAEDKRISLYVFGDEFESPRSVDSVVAEVDRLNREDADGTRRVRIHAVGFPTQFLPGFFENTGIRFANLMRVLCQRNGGTFVGLSSLRPQ